MTAVQLINRYFLENDTIDGYHLRNGRMSEYEWQALNTQAGKLLPIKMQIADHYNMRFLHHIRSEARRLSRAGKLKMIIIDYLQLIRVEGQKFGTRDLEVGYITGELKNLAKELQVPVIVLSQLNRPEKSTVPRVPRLEDLRESGNIEQDADIVLFLHKPDYYSPAAKDNNGVSWENRGKLIIAKHREGTRNSKVIFHHDKRYKKIGDTPFYESNQFPAVKS